MDYITNLYGRIKRKFQIRFERALPVDQIESIDRLMRSITEDKRWEFSASSGSGEFSQINLPADDPAAYAILYAISKLENAQKTQEPFNEHNGAYSGRSKVNASTPDGYMEAVAWLTPLTERFNPKSVEGFRNLPIYKGNEIRVIGSINFIKKHYEALRSQYKSAFAMASMNKLSARELFINAPPEPPVQILV